METDGRGTSSIRLPSRYNYSAAGHATDGDMGYEIEGRVVIDRQTLAYLLIEAVPRVIRNGR